MRTEKRFFFRNQDSRKIYGTRLLLQYLIMVILVRTRQTSSAWPVLSMDSVSAIFPRCAKTTLTMKMSSRCGQYCYRKTEKDLHDFSHSEQHTHGRTTEDIAMSGNNSLHGSHALDNTDILEEPTSVHAHGCAHRHR